jgi:hypothetical protein
MTDDELAHMRYDKLLRWCADEDGILRNRARLEQACEACGYRPGWVFMVKGMHVRDVLRETKKWGKKEEEKEQRWQEVKKLKKKADKRKKARAAFLAEWRKEPEIETEYEEMKEYFE